MTTKDCLSALKEAQEVAKMLGGLSDKEKTLTTGVITGMKLVTKNETDEAETQDDL